MFACENEVREPRGRVGWKFRTRVKAPESARGEGILIVSLSNLRDVLEMNVSPTAAFHLVMNSSSDIRSLYKYQPKTKLGSNSGKTTRTRNQPCTDAEHRNRLDGPPYQRPSSTACPHRRPVQTNASPAMSPRVGPCARTQAIETESSRAEAAL